MDTEIRTVMDGPCLHAVATENQWEVNKEAKFVRTIIREHDGTLRGVEYAPDFAKKELWFKGWI